MTYTLREADPADAPSLEVVRQQASEAGFTGEYPRAVFADRIATPEDRLSGWIEADETTVLVLETPFTVVSFGVYDRVGSTILALYTAPDHQGNGHGNRLLTRFEDIARKVGNARVHTTVTRNAVGFFENRGYERVDVTEHRGLEMIRLRKDLS